MGNKKVLVTGGAGYLGAVLAGNLVKEGFDLKIFDRFYFGLKPLNYLDGTVELVKGDIRNPPESLFDDVESVIHLAALSNDPLAEFNPKANFEINTKASLNLAKIAKKKGVNRFIFASSCSIYDLGMANDEMLRDESSQVTPRSAYPKSKYEAENALAKLVDKKFNILVLRMGTIFGFSPRMRYDLVVNTMVKNAMARGVVEIFCGGEQWRPLVDVEDAACAFVLALKAPTKKINGQIINISLGNFLVLDIASIVTDFLNKHYKISSKIVFKKNDHKDRSYKVSGQKAREILGFVANNKLGDSVIKMVKNIKRYKMTDFDNAIYYNINWMKPLLFREKI